MSYGTVPLQSFADVFSATIELSSEAIGGQIVSVSDEFFAAASQLLETEPAPSFKGQFGPSGAIYSGWESRRHNPTYDWCIIRLGTTGTICGFDVDTSHFNGNEAPQVSVEAFHGSLSEEPLVDDARWVEILPKVNLGPNARHLFTVNESFPTNFVKLNMYPDGGIARFRVYGHVSPVHPADETEVFDLAHVFSGGLVEYQSDQHFGIGANLILPGRGKNMGAGWETKRSRQKGHKDWVIIKMGAPGFLEYVEIDTNHFKGNFPESCEIHALYLKESPDWRSVAAEEQEWNLIVPRTKLGPHKQHYFQVENTATTEGKIFTHVQVTIYPDGGLQRVRVFGRRNTVSPVVRPDTAFLSLDSSSFVEAEDSVPSQAVQVVPVLPLTAEAFAPFGAVIQAYEDATAAPKGTRVTPANEGSATKFHKLALLQSCYRSDSGASSGISVYRCQPAEVSSDGSLVLKMLERHPFTNQAFIPMGKVPGVQSASGYIVVVAKTGLDDHPDIGTLRAFIATATQGIVYGTAVWHQPMTVLNGTMDFACVETQIGDGSSEDCEIWQLDQLVRLRMT